MAQRKVSDLEVALTSSPALSVLKSTVLWERGMVTFIEWMTRMKLREATSLIPFHHSRERVPQQPFLAPRPVLTPEFLGFTKGQGFFPSLASLPSFQPHTQAGTAKEKRKQNLPTSFSGLSNPHQPAPGVIDLPLPWLTIQRTFIVLLSLLLLCPLCYLV